MKFLKTIQKHESEKPVEHQDSADLANAESVASSNSPAGLLSMPDLKIGSPRQETALGQQLVVTETNGNGRPNQLVPLGIGMTRELPEVREVDVNIERVNPRLISITHPRSPYCEEYRNLRTQVLHKSRKRKLQAIVISSVGPSEGKSVTALNLSWLFAQADGMRALVIDSDLRRPSLAEYLGIDAPSGLSEVLAGNASLVESVVKLQPAGLFLLPGGEARPDVAELISGPRFSELLKEARGFFDFVIIDAPPLGIFTDASLLINQADGAILVIRADHTKYKDVDRILDSLPRERMLGTVLNQSEVPLLDESYYNYSYYDRNEPIKA
ncbi:MAG: CpsD/CapB family tyrosine-protein kinase [Pyrinomonadaceae bacterium]